jgi:phage recombination protein Bet
MDMNAVVEKELPPSVSRRGITEAEWRTLANNLYPGAKPESVLMAVDYCRARKLDPLKKPCHIVPMRVKQGDDYIWRDVVMPGIYEYRTTAARTGLYLGHSKPEYGPPIDYLGTTAPEWCDLTVYRWNSQAQIRAEYPVRIMFIECAATTKDRKTGTIACNDRWNKAPQQMLTKCAEAAALREAFPDELGGTHTDDEVAGKDLPPEPVKIDPRGDAYADVDFEHRDKHVGSLVDIMNLDKDEYEIADLLRQHVTQHLEPFPELYMAVNDKLAAEKIISKAKFREYLALRPPPKSRQTVLIEREPGSDDEKE